LATKKKKEFQTTRIFRNKKSDLIVLERKGKIIATYGNENLLVETHLKGLKLADLSGKP